MKNDLKVLLVLAGLLFSGCSMKMGKFSMVTTKQLEIMNASMEKIRGDVIGVKECSIIVLFPTCWYPKIDQAVENALEKTGGDVLVNAEAKYRWWWIPYIYGKTKMQITGDVYKIIRSTDHAH